MVKERRKKLRKKLQQATDAILVITFNECEKVSQEYQKRIRENYLLKTEIDEVERLRDIIILILPMAKGYAYANKVSSNLEYIRVAESAVAKEMKG